MILIKSTVTVDKFASKRAWQRGMRQAHAEQGEYWHTKILPKHFEPGAGAKYGHKPRSDKYQRRKKKLAAAGKVKYGGMVDNVATGRMETMLKGMGVFRAFPTRVTVYMTGPRYITMRPYETNQPDKAKEITALTAQEISDLENVLEIAARGYLTKYGEKKTYNP
jgi:hypothetical protein